MSQVPPLHECVSLSSLSPFFAKVRSSAQLPLLTLVHQALLPFLGGREGFKFSKCQAQVVLLAWA